MAKKPAPKSHPFQDLIKAGNQAAIAKALKDPGLRKYVPDAVLRKQDPKLAASRALTTRLKQPVTPGSPVTEGDLARYGKAAAQVQFGGQATELEQGLRRAGQVREDTGTFYQQYIDSVRQNAQRIADIQAGAQGQLTGLAASAPAVGAQTLAGVQNPAVQDAQARGATAADFSTLQSAANASRQNMIASFQAQQQASGGAANQQASNYANVVAPAQKLQALAGAQQKIEDIHKQVTDLKGQMGAADITAREKLRGDERSRVIAQATLTNNAIANAPATKVAVAGATTAARTKATLETKNAQKLGLTTHQYRLLGPAEQARRLNKLEKDTKGPKADPYYTEGPFTGKRHSEVDAMTPAQIKTARQAYEDKKNKTKEPGSDQAFKDMYGVTPADSGRVATQRNNITTATSVLNNTVLTGPTFKNAAKTDANRHRLAALLLKGAKARPIYDDKNRIKKDASGVPKYTNAVNPVDALTTSVILDLWQFGGITGGTAQKLHQAGYRVPTLGLPMKGTSYSKGGGPD